MGLHLHGPGLIDGRVPLPKLAAGGQPPGEDLPAARDQQIVVAACRHHGRAPVVRPLQVRQKPVKGLHVLKPCHVDGLRVAQSSS